MKYLALIALVLAGCSQEPRQYGAPAPLVWNAPTFGAPAPQQSVQAPVFGAPRMTCTRFGDMVNCF
jgi:hypothetical protein